MQSHLPEQDTVPWYRQFWPWFLIALPASVVVAGLSTLFIANRHADDLVVDDYYKDGLAINRQLEKKDRAQQLGITATLIFGEGKVTATMTGPVTAGQLRLLLSHPLEADRDFETPLRLIAPGFYQGKLPAPVAPRWHWTLQPQALDSWRLDGSVVPSDIGDAGLN